MDHFPNTVHLVVSKTILESYSKYLTSILKHSIGLDMNFYKFSYGTV